ncbi:MAG: nucleoid-associated protein, YbaB/EbfC family [Epsilonproteobacteria bacterium]|jgi:DNA-binding YbaB/EbfC family protein|nr:nucleoid-associated protein, YbaB/EbfC family [Campylobacterota bacterium]NPA88985.1 YbaB/EbfC family nucleoid-associated protein [Campylobacterota bacterium]
MFENFNLNLGDMLEQLKKQLENNEGKEYTAKSGGGLVEVTLNNKLEVTNIKIDDSLLSDKESLQVLLISALNDAIKMALEDKQSSVFDILQLGEQLFSSSQKK